MTAPHRRWARELLHFWFHTLKPSDWFQPAPTVDAELRKRFEPDLLMLWNRPAHEFLGNAQTALAAVLLFDQVPRNIYRETRRSFAFDPLARTITRRALVDRYDLTLPRQQRHFLAMPLMHSEFIADQLWSREYFTGLGRNYGMPHARSHYAMIARFGRFPHRNKLLGRISTPAEKRAIKAGFVW
ncbi:DUF924 domain-containing protein [Altericroceibacterium spongiae]|uniref:DUF924 domain-containing protein n=1 Tax=Altericroceibacterium spongiae TaxID=2320269 RepID=A0A420EPH3_9SPHN|nr:DUF924 family protein [Altericroceibacterium spongiae]RKF22564.1 DUF924 domain-containing protein [Altericroceibacterium spongiae]